MSTTRRVLVLGASGMIGRAIQEEAHGAEELVLLSASHRHRPKHVRMDYESLTTPQAWANVLRGQRIDAVVNCVGIWTGTVKRFELVQYTVPVALFDACNQLGVRVVHLSALGFSAQSPLPYASTKARADIPEYFEALRAGMGLEPARLKLKLPTWLFQVGEFLGAHFVNRQTWALLETGTQSGKQNPAALPYDHFATAADRRMTQETQLYWFARLGLAFLWLWTAAVTYFVWPRLETLSWLDSLWPGLGTPFWLAASCVLDTTMGLASLLWPRKRLWLAQFGLTAVYSVGLAVALPWSWGHPFGPLTKNVAVLATMLFLAMQESRRGR